LARGVAGHLRRHGLNIDRVNYPDFNKALPTLKEKSLFDVIGRSGPVPLTDLRTWDALSSLLPASPASDDLGLVTGTFGTSAPSVQTGDLKAAGATTRRAAFQFKWPWDPEVLESAAVRINAGMVTTVSDGTATVDMEITRDAAPTVDLVTTAAQSINSLTAADKDFALSIANLEPGELLTCRVSIAINDTATGTAVIGKINSIEILPVENVID
jgi:hypothetical protein